MDEKPHDGGKIESWNKCGNLKVIHKQLNDATNRLPQTSYMKTSKPSFKPGSLSPDSSSQPSPLLQPPHTVVPFHAATLPIARTLQTHSCQDP